MRITTTEDDFAERPRRTFLWARGGKAAAAAEGAADA